MDQASKGADASNAGPLDQIESTYEQRAVPARRLRRRDAATVAIALAALLWLVWAARPVPILSNADFAVHELGHLLAWLLPPMWQALAGSVAQVCVPLALSAYFAFSADGLYASGGMMIWAGLSARDVSAYIADAPYQRLALQGGQHDWAFILGPQGLDRMGAAAVISGVVWWLAIVFILAGAGLAVFDTVRAVRWESRNAAERERIRSLPRREPRRGPYPEIDPEATPLEPSPGDPGGPPGGAS